MENKEAIQFFIHGNLHWAGIKMINYGVTHYKPMCVSFETPVVSEKALYKNSILLFII